MKKKYLVITLAAIIILLLIIFFVVIRKGSLGNTNPSETLTANDFTQLESLGNDIGSLGSTTSNLDQNTDIAS